VNLPLGVRSHLRVDEYHVCPNVWMCVVRYVHLCGRFLWRTILSLLTSNLFNTCLLKPLLALSIQSTPVLFIYFFTSCYASSSFRIFLDFAYLFSLLTFNPSSQVLIEELELETGVTARKSSSQDGSLEGVVASPGDVVSEWRQRGGDLGGFHRFDDQVKRRFKVGSFGWCQ